MSTGTHVNRYASKYSRLCCTPVTRLTTITSNNSFWSHDNVKLFKQEMPYSNDTNLQFVCLAYTFSNSVLREDITSWPKTVNAPISICFWQVQHTARQHASSATLTNISLYVHLSNACSILSKRLHIKKLFMHNDRSIILGFISSNGVTKFRRKTLNGGR